MDTLYLEYNKKSDKELIEIIAKEGGSQTGSTAGSIQLRNRDLANAILNSRRARIESTHNVIMIILTIAILGFTIVVAVLTGLLVYKEFFAN